MIRLGRRALLLTAFSLLASAATAVCVGAVARSFCERGGIQRPAGLLPVAPGV
jgi:hypothetical protein